MYNNYMGNNGSFTVPPNPIGNIVNVSNNGYNPYGNMNGYYNNNYGYYNPYLEAQQRQIQEAQMREQERNQSNIWKEISKSVNKAMHVEIDNMDKHLQMYDPESMRQEEVDYDRVVTNNIFNSLQTGYYGNLQRDRIVESHNTLYDKSISKYKDMGFVEYANNFSNIYLEMLEKQKLEQERNLSQLYNRNDYKSLINSSGSSNSYFNTIFKARQSDSIDDNEIQLPGYLKDNLNASLQERKKKFFDSIYNK